MTCACIRSSMVQSWIFRGVSAYGLLWLVIIPGSAAVFAVGCPSTTFWQHQISEVIYNLTSLYGVDGVYIGSTSCDDFLWFLLKIHHRPNRSGYSWAMFPIKSQSHSRSVAVQTNNNNLWVYGRLQGGGDYWREGFERLLFVANQLASNGSGAPLATEENSEVYMNVVSGYLTPLAYVTDSGIPLFAAVYSGDCSFLTSCAIW